MYGVKSFIGLAPVWIRYLELNSQSSTVSFHYKLQKYVSPNEYLICNSQLCSFGHFSFLTTRSSVALIWMSSMHGSKFLVIDNGLVILIWLSFCYPQFFERLKAFFALAVLILACYLNNTTKYHLLPRICAFFWVPWHQFFWNGRFSRKRS